MSTCVDTELGLGGAKHGKSQARRRLRSSRLRQPRLTSGCPPAHSCPTPTSNLELEVENNGVPSAVDNKRIQIDETTDVPVFTATAAATQVKLEWVYPEGDCDFVRILVRDDAPERDTIRRPAARRSLAYLGLFLSPNVTATLCTSPSSANGIAEDRSLSRRAPLF